MAPGVNILNADPVSVAGSGNEPYNYRSSTSEATAYATGTAALSASVNPGLVADPAGLKRCTMDTSKPVVSTVGKTVTGDMVDAQAASDLTVEPPDTAAPTGSVSINDNARKTTKQKVRLALEASDPEPGIGVAEMRFSKNNSPT